MSDDERSDRDGNGSQHSGDESHHSGEDSASQHSGDEAAVSEICFKKVQDICIHLNPKRMLKFNKTFVRNNLNTSKTCIYN